MTLMQEFALEALILEALEDYQWEHPLSAQAILEEMVDHEIVEPREVALPMSGRGLIPALRRLLADGKVTRKVEDGLVVWGLPDWED